MISASRIASLAAAVAFVGVTACSNDGPSAPTPGAALFAKSGTAPSGGSGGGGGGGGGGGKSGGGSGGAGVDNPGTAPSGPPVAPSYTARIDSIGTVPTTYYYGSPSVWKIGGYIFEANTLTHLKPLNGPFVVGACVSVTFSNSITGAYLASEMTTEPTTACR
jgi:hypothetical protein